MSEVLSITKHGRGLIWEVESVEPRELCVPDLEADG